MNGVHLLAPPQNYDDIRLLIDEIDWLTDTDRARLFERNAAALFGRTGLRATPSPEAV